MILNNVLYERIMVQKPPQECMGMIIQNHAFCMTDIAKYI